jgi:hypothetical protein
MREGNDLKWSRYKLNNLTKPGISNENYVKSMKKRFGVNPAKSNYNVNKKI